MTRFVLLPMTFALAAMLGVGLTIAGPGDSTGPRECCRKDSKQCCSQEAQAAGKSGGQEPKAGCCLRGNAATDTAAKARPCYGDACNADKDAKAVCKLCASDSSLANNPAKASEDTPDSAKPAITQGGQGRGGMGRGRGMGRGPGMMGRGPGAMEGMREDMTTLHAMFGDRDKIRRKVKNLPDGAEAVTESDDEAIADLLREHVPAMEDRVVGNSPLPPMTFHPIFVELIKHADDYTLTYEETEKGMKVKYTSEDPFVVMLVQEHAKLVSRFIKNGMQEIHKPYTLPKLKTGRKAKSAPAAQAKEQAK